MSEYPSMDLKALTTIADILDQKGLHKEANVVTRAMVKIAFSEKDKGKARSEGRSYAHDVMNGSMTAKEALEEYIGYNGRLEISEFKAAFNDELRMLKDENSGVF